jgi:hypothetical protein
MPEVVKYAADLLGEVGGGPDASWPLPGRSLPGRRQVGYPMPGGRPRSSSSYASASLGSPCPPDLGTRTSRALDKALLLHLGNG